MTFAEWYAEREWLITGYNFKLSHDHLYVILTARLKNWSSGFRSKSGQ